MHTQLTQQMAKYRTAELIRDAEQARLTAGYRSSVSRARRQRMRDRLRVWLNRDRRAAALRERPAPQASR